MKPEMKHPGGNRGAVKLRKPSVPQDHTAGNFSLQVRIRNGRVLLCGITPDQDREISEAEIASARRILVAVERCCDEA